MLLLAILSGVAFAILPPSDVTWFRRLTAFTTIPTPQNAPPKPTTSLQCGGADGEPLRDTLAGGSSLRLRVFNDEYVEADILTRTMKRVDDVYSQIRIRTLWTTTEPVMDDGMPLFDIVITNDALSQAETRTSGGQPAQRTVGAAHLSLRRGYAHYGLIRDATVGANLLIRVHALADVIAHELGHLLLPAGSNSQVGIMRSSRALFEILKLRPARTFGSRDGEVIRRRVFAGGIGRPVRNAQPCGIGPTQSRNGPPTRGRASSLVSPGGDESLHNLVVGASDAPAASLPAPEAM